MKYISLERPNLYDDVISLDVFDYSDELTLEAHLFSVDVIRFEVHKNFKDKVSDIYKVLIYNLSIEAEDIDLDEVNRLMRQEYFEIESMDIFISATYRRKK